MQGNQRAALAANKHKPAKGADQDEALQLVFWRLHEGLKAWKDMHPTQVVPIPGTPEFRKAMIPFLSIHHVIDYEAKDMDGGLEIVHSKTSHERDKLP